MAASFGGGLDPALMLDPSSSGQYMEMARKQQLAQMLMGAFQNAQNSPNPQSASVNGINVQARRGALQNIAPILSAALASKANSDAVQSQIDYFNPKPAFQGAPYDAGAAAQAPEGVAAPAPGAAPSGGAPAPSGLVQPNSMIPAGMDRSTALRLIRMMGPEKYGEMVSAQYKPTDMQMQIRSAGIDPNSALGRQMVQQSLAKSLNIAPIDVREGGTLVDPITRQPFFSAPHGGTQVGWGPNGPIEAAIPGAPGAAAAMTGAETAARVSNTPQTFPTGGGGSTVGYPGDVLGAPPAMRGTVQTPGQTSGATVGGQGRTPGAPASASAPTVKPPQTAAAPSDPWASVPKLAISNKVGAPDAFTEGTLKASGEKHAALSTKFGEQADLADQKLQYNAEAMKALPNAEVGPLSEWMTHNRAQLVELGVPEKLIPGSGTVAPTIELNKFLKNAALQGAKATFGPRMTQNEVMLQHEELSPSTSMTRDAIGSLINSDNIKNQYAKQRAQDYGKYIDQKGDPLKFESWYAKNFPITEFSKAQQAAPAPAAAPPVPRPGQQTSGPAPAPSADVLRAEMVRRGLLKP